MIVGGAIVLWALALALVVALCRMAAAGDGVLPPAGVPEPVAPSPRNEGPALPGPTVPV